jgi:hypothetical protein
MCRQLAFFIFLSLLGARLRTVFFNNLLRCLSSIRVTLFLRKLTNNTAFTKYQSRPACHYVNGYEKFVLLDLLANEVLIHAKHRVW